MPAAMVTAEIWAVGQTQLTSPTSVEPGMAASTWKLGTTKSLMGRPPCSLAKAIPLAPAAWAMAIRVSDVLSKLFCTAAA